jgi:hypothetical protein
MDAIAIEISDLKQDCCRWPSQELIMRAFDLSVLKLCRWIASQYGTYDRRQYFCCGVRFIARYRHFYKNTNGTSILKGARGKYIFSGVSMKHIETINDRTQNGSAYADGIPKRKGVIC